MECLNLDDISRAADTFSKAMVNDPLHVYFFPDPGSRLKKLTAMYTFMIRMNFLKAFRTSASCEGIIIWEEPFEHAFKVSFKEYITGSLLFFKVGPRSLLRMMKYQEWSAKLKKESIEDPYWYLNVVIVDPEHQGKGFASKLIKPVLVKADENRQKVCLETQNENNLPIYEKYGFTTLSEHRVPGTEIRHFIMVRE